MKIDYSEVENELMGKLGITVKDKGTWCYKWQFIEEIEKLDTKNNKAVKTFYKKWKMHKLDKLNFWNDMTKYCKVNNKPIDVTLVSFFKDLMKATTKAWGEQKETVNYIG